ncbi:MAG: hypothetical protein WCC12_23935, partial [Anaerolineales bacterium]
IRRLSQKILLAILLYALLSTAGDGQRTVRAQEDGYVNLNAQVGFDGFCKEGQWIPVHVAIENTGPDLDAEVRASYDNGGGRSLTSTTIQLPATSRKEFFLYMYSSGGYKRELTVALFSNGKVLKRVQRSINCINTENTIVGVLADTSSTFDVLNDVKPLRGYLRVAQLEIGDLPDRGQAWEALDALVVSNVDTGTLTPGQRQALKDWVAGGGKLFVTGGTNWQGTTAGLKDILPIDPTGTRRVDSLSNLQDYVRNQTALDSNVILASGQIRAGARVLVDQEGIPLLLEKPLGFGKVYFFAADPALRPLSTWSGMTEVYDHLLAPKSQIPRWAEGTRYDYRARQALGTIPELGLPSILYICGLLGLYIAIIGPLNYIVLRRAKRRELAWVTIPALVLLFTCLAYGTGFSYRGVTPILNRLTVAQAWDGVEESQVNSLVGVYSPLRTKYDLEAGADFMFKPYANDISILQANNNWTTEQRDAIMIMPDVPVEIGDMKAVTVEGSLPALQFDHDLVLAVSKVNAILSGNITNHTQYTLRDAVLVTSGNWKRLGDIGPGETKTVKLALGASPNGPAFYSLSSEQILGVTQLEIQTDADAARRSAFLDSILYADYGLQGGNWGIYLMGWLDQIDVPAGLQDRTFEAIDTMLYVDSLSPAIKTEPDEFRLPMSLFVWETSMEGASPYQAREIPAGGYSLRLRPVIPIAAENVKSMSLYLTSNALPAELVASIWDYEAQDWVRVAVTRSYTDIPEPHRYVGPDGEIKLKIVSNRSDWTEINGFNIAVVVEP